MLHKGAALISDFAFYRITSPLGAIEPVLEKCRYYWPASQIFIIIIMTRRQLRSVATTLHMMTVILCLLPLPSDTQWWSIANLHDPRVTRTSRSSPPDSVGQVSGLDSNNLLQDLMRWRGGVQSGHVSEQHVTSLVIVIADIAPPMIPIGANMLNIRGM